jgi:hypothetical protein
MPGFFTFTILVNGIFNPIWQKISLHCYHQATVWAGEASCLMAGYGAQFRKLPKRALR